MVELLQDTGSELARIVPYDGEGWISAQWRAIARDLIVVRAPDVNLSGLGVKILLTKTRFGYDLKWALRELLVATNQVLLSVSGGAADSLTIELLYFPDRSGVARGVVSVGPAVLTEFDGGTPFAICEDSRSAVGTGVLMIDDDRIDSSLSHVLNDQHVRTIQFEVVRPIPGYEAVLFIATRSQVVELDSLRSQSLLRELVALLELTLLSELLGPAQSSERPVRVELTPRYR